MGFIGELLEQRRPTTKKSNEHLRGHGGDVALELVSVDVQRFLAGAPRVFLEGEGWEAGVNHSHGVEGIATPYIALVGR